jgi:hypothetical protein
MSIARVVAIGICACVVGCETHQPTIGYPRLIEAGAMEAAFDCAALDDAILKTDAVRWVMRQDGARLLSSADRGARTVGNTAMVAGAFVGCVGCYPGFTDEGHSSLDSADRRLQSLLQLKQDKACPRRATSLEGLTDLDVHRAIASLLAGEMSEKDRGRVRELLGERMRLFDGLRAP